MSFGLYDPERRYRRRVRKATIRVGFYLVSIGIAAALGYQFGVQETRGRETHLAQQLADAEAARAALEQNVIRLGAAARTTQILYDELRQRYEREVPTGTRRELAELVAHRLEQGIDAERLAFVIRAADEPTDCSGAETRRFILPTPAYRGPNTAVGFADGRITVTGRGENARSANGGALGWFDPAQPVTVTFTLIGGEESAVSGQLPLHHSIALAGAEYRFTIVEGDRSFVNVTADRCSFPR